MDHNKSEDFIAAVVTEGPAVGPAPAENAAGTQARPQQRAFSEQSLRTHRLLQEAKECTDPARVRELHDQVVTENIGVARSLAGRYRGKGVEQDDLEQIACLGLIKAVAGCDPDLCESFLQYAVPTILGELKRHFRDKGWAIRPTRRIQELHAAVTAARSELTQMLGREPVEAELVALTGADEASIREAMMAGKLVQADSLDAITEAGAPFPQSSTESVDQYDQIENALTLSPAVATLTDRDRQILRMRFLEGLTQSEIGAALSLSQMHVSRLLRDILAKLRSELEPALLAS